MKEIHAKYWKIKLLENQYYLGRSIIVLKRKCSMLSDLKDKEIKELFELMKKIENGLRKEFKTTMFNWTCLMNDSYKPKNPKPQVHWHLWPRYKKKVKFAGEIFEDEVFAHHYNKFKIKKVDKEVLHKINEKFTKILK